MKQFLITSFIIVVISNSAKSQSFNQGADISWSSSRHLKWQDFIGTIDNKSDFLALCASSIICKPYFINDSVMLWVEAVFIRDQSWKKRTYLDSFDLTHEQTHFNISELFARKLRKIIDEEIKSAKKSFTSDLLLKIDSVFKGLSIECEEMQELYDKQTNHSINKDEQIKWNSSIWESLENLNHWTFNSFFIGNIIVYKD